MVKKEKEDFLAEQGFTAANCLIRVVIDPDFSYRKYFFIGDTLAL